MSNAFDRSKNTDIGILPLSRSCVILSTSSIDVNSVEWPLCIFMLIWWRLTNIVHFKVLFVLWHLFRFFKKSCVYICIIILCIWQDVKFLRFSRVIFYHLQKCVFYLWLLVWETGIYTTIMAMPLLTLNWSYVLSDIHIITRAFKKLPMAVLNKLILSVAMIRLWIFYSVYIPLTISHLLDMYCII